MAFEYFIRCSLLKTGMRILKHFPNQSESDYYDYYEGVLLWFDPTVGTAEGGCWHVHYGDGDAEDISEADLPPLLRRGIEHDRNADPTGSNLRIFTYASFEGIAPKRPQHAELWGRQPICLSEAIETRISRGPSSPLLSPPYRRLLSIRCHHHRQGLHLRCRPGLHYNRHPPRLRRLR